MICSFLGPYSDAAPHVSAEDRSSSFGSVPSAEPEEEMCTKHRDAEGRAWLRPPSRRWERRWTCQANEKPTGPKSRRFSPGPGPLDRQRKCCVPLIALCSLTVRPLHISLEVHWERRFVSTEPVTQQTLNRPAERIAGFHSFVRSFENGYQVLGAKVKMYSVVPWASGRSRTSGYAGSGRRLFGREGAGDAGNVSAEAV